MNPPTEQLVRDYLNRLSVAARGRLGLGDRQALLDQTRARIEAQSGGAASASNEQVRKALADLGDPVALVEAEYARVEARRVVAASRKDTEVIAGVRPGGFRPWVRPAEPAGSYLDAPVPGGGSRPGGDLPAGGESPAGGGSRPGGEAPGGAESTAGGGSAVGGGSRAGGGSLGGGGSPGGGSQAGQDLTSESSASLVPRPGVSPEYLAGPPVVGSREEAVPQAGDSAGHLAGPRAGDSREDAGPQEAALELYVEPMPTDEFEVVSDLAADEVTAVGRLRAWIVRLAGAISRVVRRVGVVAWDNKLEAMAVLLLGPGGAVFPPVWIPGALLVMLSRGWDVRDKWLAVVWPVLLVIVGTAFIVFFGGQHRTLGDYAFEAWVGAGRLCRVLAVAGACYLAWRLHRGRRQPRQPPWNIPHKLDI